MHICFLADPNSIHTLRWARELSVKGYKITLISPKQIINNSITKYVDYINVASSFSLHSKLEYIKSIYKIRSIVHQLRPDILHAHYASSYGFLGKLCSYTPYIVSVWGSDVFSFPRKNLINKSILSSTLNTASYIASTSKEMALEIRKYTDNENIHITPFGVDTSSFTPKGSANISSNGDLTIGSIKSLEPIYGMTKLVKAYIELASQYPLLKLLIIGNGSQYSELKSMINNADLEQNAKILSAIPHDLVPQYLNKIDIFAVPSYQESFGVSALEASSAALPVIASNVGGLPEVVIDSHTGFLVDPSNIQQLVQKLDLLIQTPSLRLQLGKQGRQFVLNHYEWQNCVDKMCQLYTQSKQL